MLLRFFFTYISLFLLAEIAFAQIKYQQRIIDSLESYRPIAESGWDELDLCIALCRLYLVEGNEQQANEQLLRIYEIGRVENIPLAGASGRILESLRAHLLEGDDDTAIELSKEAIEIAKILNDKETLAYARFQLAERYYSQQDEPAAIALILESMKDMDESVTRQTQGNTHQLIGHIYAKTGQHEKSLKHLNKALAYYEEMMENPRVDTRIGRISALNVSPEMHLVATLNQLGDLYFTLGSASRALELKLQGLALMRSIGNQDMLARMYFQTGKLYAELGRLGEAVANFQQARIGFEELNLQKDIHRVNESMIPTLVRMSEYALAEELTKDNIEYYEQSNDTLYLASAFVHASGIFMMLESAIDLPKAKYYLDGAAPLVEKISDVQITALYTRMHGIYQKRNGNLALANHFLNRAIKISNASNLLFDARVTYDLADNFLKMRAYDSARLYVSKAIGMAKQLKDRDLAMDSYQLLSSISGAAGDYEQAYKNHLTFFDMYDSLFQSKAQAKLKEEQVRQGIYNYQQDKELAERNAQLLSDRNRLFMFLGAFLLLALCVVVYLYLFLRKVKANTQNQNIELTQLNQTKDKFFGIIAHDLRSPLVGLHSVADQVDYYLKKGRTDRLEQVAKSISSTSKKLNELLDNLLGWALLQNGMIPYHPERVDLQSSVASVIDLFQPLYDMKEVILTSNIPNGEMVMADEKAVHTILRNLISNALKFTPQHGSVVVESQTTSQEVTVSIRDTGTGISTTQLAKLFDLDGESTYGTMGEKGTGLGLVLCRELVELNRGSITVTSDLGKGSIFSFKLPKAD